MRQSPSTAQNLAQLLLTHEAGGDQDLETLAAATERACDTLRLHLARLMGLDGFTLLLIRALTFARTEFPWLEGIRAEKDGSLKGLHAVAGEREPAEAAAGFASVLSHFLGLLVVFIGEDLTLRLLQGAWPDIDLVGKNQGLEETK